MKINKETGNDLILIWLQELKDCCIDNVETNFDQYLLEDLYHAGKVDQLFDNESWYLYYLEKANKINFIINHLLEEIEPNKDLLLNAISIKKVTDQKLIEYGKSDYVTIYEDLGFDTFGTSLTINLNPEKVKNKEIFIQKLWETLVSKNWISNDVESFKANFADNMDGKPIKWTSTQLNLVGVIKYLIQNKYINIKGNPPSLISNHFQRNGKPINPRSVGVTYSNMFTDGYMKDDYFQFIERCNS